MMTVWQHLREKYSTKLICLNSGAEKYSAVTALSKVSLMDTSESYLSLFIKHFFFFFQYIYISIYYI